MSDEPSPSEFLISKMEGMDDVTQVLIVTRTDEGEIWCCVDEENKEIRIGIPVGNATVPNQTLTMNYMEGLSGPDPLQPVCGP